MAEIPPPFFQEGLPLNELPKSDLALDSVDEVNSKRRATIEVGNNSRYILDQLKRKIKSLFTGLRDKFQPNKIDDWGHSTADWKKHKQAVQRINDLGPNLGPARYNADQLNGAASEFQQQDYFRQTASFLVYEASTSVNAMEQSESQDLVDRAKLVTLIAEYLPGWIVKLGDLSGNYVSVENFDFQAKTATMFLK